MRTFNQAMKDAAFNWSVDYKPYDERLEYREYARHGFINGAEWLSRNHQYHKVRMWTVKVFDDHGDGARYYEVPATSGADAQLIAFIMDGGIEGDEVVLESGHLELARMHTELIRVSL